MEWAGSRKETACQIYRDLVLENIEEDALIPNPRIDGNSWTRSWTSRSPYQQARQPAVPSPPLLPLPQTTSSLPG